MEKADKKILPCHDDVRQGLALRQCTQGDTRRGLSAGIRFVQIDAAPKWVPQPCRVRKSVPELPWPISNAFPKGIFVPTYLVRRWRFALNRFSYQSSLRPLQPNDARSITHVTLSQDRHLPPPIAERRAAVPTNGQPHQHCPFASCILARFSHFFRH